MEALEDDIRDAVPDLDRGSIDTLVELLNTAADEPEELKDLEEADLTPLLDGPSARRLLDYFKHKYGSQTRGGDGERVDNHAEGQSRTTPITERHREDPPETPGSGPWSGPGSDHQTFNEDLKTDHHLQDAKRSEVCHQRSYDADLLSASSPPSSPPTPSAEGPTLGDQRHRDIKEAGFEHRRKVYFHTAGRINDNVKLLVKFDKNGSPAIHEMVKEVSNDEALFCCDVDIPDDIDQLAYCYDINGKQLKKFLKLDKLRTTGDVFKFDRIFQESTRFPKRGKNWRKENIDDISKMLQCIHFGTDLLSTGAEYLRKIHSFKAWAMQNIAMSPEDVEQQILENMELLIDDHVNELRGMIAQTSGIERRVSIALVFICLYEEKFIEDSSEDWKEVVFNALEVHSTWTDTTTLIETFQNSEKCDERLRRFIEQFLAEEPKNDIWVKCIPLLYMLKNKTPIGKDLAGDLRDDQHGILLCSLDIAEGIGSHAADRFISSLTLDQMKCITENVPMHHFLGKARWEMDPERRTISETTVANVMVHIFYEMKRRDPLSDWTEEYQTAYSHCKAIMDLLTLSPPPIAWNNMSARIYTVEIMSELAAIQGENRADIDQYVSTQIVPFLHTNKGDLHMAQEYLEVYKIAHCSKGWDANNRSAIRERAIAAAEDLLKCPMRQQIFHLELEVFKTLLSEVLNRELTHLHEDSTYEHFFTSEVIHAFISLCNQERTSFRKQFSREIERLTNYTMMILRNFHSAEITFSQYDAICKNKERFFFLVTQAQNPRGPNKDELQRLVGLRSKQVDAFRRKGEELGHLSYRCNQMGCKSVSKEIRRWIFQMKNQKLSEIYNLPSYDDQLKTDWMDVNPFIGIPPETIEAAKELYRLKDTCFNNHFLGYVQQLGGVDTMDIGTLTREVLNPLLKAWITLCHAMEDGSIILRSVVALFRSVRGTPSEEQILQVVTEMCHRHIPERCEQIKRFFRLRDHEKAAQTIIRKKKKVPTAFAYPLEFIGKTLKADSGLSSMTEKVVEITKGLEDLDSTKINILNAFIQAKELVLWLQKELKSAKEVRALVRSFTTSPRNAVDITNASNLETVATVFSPLIFDIPKEAGVDVVWKGLNKVLRLSKEEAGVLEKLADLRHKLQWLKDLKTSQSGEGVDALKQVETINSAGKYIVGKINKDLENYQDMDQIICVEVPGSKGNEDAELGSGQSETERQIFTYSQLKELQSKLMLVSGENEQCVREVDHFVEILDGVSGVAETYSRIMDCGNTLFQNWHSTFLCDRDADVNTYIDFGLSDEILPGSKEDATVLEHLRQVRDFMDHCLTGWKNHLSSKRKTCPALNNFTTAQIVLLRKGLSKISSPDPTAIPAGVYPLLHSVHPHCNLNDLKESWRATIKCMTENETVSESAIMIEDELLKAEDERVVKNLIGEGIRRELILKAIKETNSHDQKELMMWCWSKQDKDEREGNIDSTSIQREESHDMIAKTILTNVFKKTGRCSLHTTLTNLWHRYLGTTSKSVKDLLSIEHLGTMLTRLGETSKEKKLVRQFPEYFKKEKSTDCVCPKADIWKTILSIYMRDPECPFPSREEILLCSTDTSFEEIELLLLRAFQNTEKVFMLVHADSLVYDVSKRVEEHIQKITQGCPDYRLVVICRAEMEDKSPLVPALSAYRIETTLDIDPNEIKEYVSNKLKFKQGDRNPCATADPERFTVRIVKSHRAGVGKGLCIQNMENNAGQCKNSNHQDDEMGKEDDSDKVDVIRVPLHGKTIDEASMLNRLCKFIQEPNCKQGRIFHIDIGHEMNKGVDDLLFHLVILGSIVDPTGNLWLRSERDFYAIEIMPLQRWEVDPSLKGTEEGLQNIHHMLDLLPTITCHGPEFSLMTIKWQEKEGKDTMESHNRHDQLIDADQFRSEPFRRVYQYLKRIDSDERGPIKVDLEKMEESMVDCLETFIQHCGVVNPSWAELNHFIQFLNIQWKCYEESIFCHLADIDKKARRHSLDDLPDLPEFVVKAMLQMSKDFATRSLVIAEKMNTSYSEEKEKNKEVVADYQFKRKWESSPHPYVFFNSDTISMTFMGYHVGLSEDKKTADLLDPKTETCIEKDIMTAALYFGLVGNRVDLRSDFDHQKRLFSLKMSTCQ